MPRKRSSQGKRKSPRKSSRRSRRKNSKRQSPGRKYRGLWNGVIDLRNHAYNKAVKQIDLGYEFHAIVIAMEIFHKLFPAKFALPNRDAWHIALAGVGDVIQKIGDYVSPITLITWLFAWSKEDFVRLFTLSLWWRSTDEGMTPVFVQMWDAVKTQFPVEETEYLWMTQIALFLTQNTNGATIIEYVPENARDWFKKEGDRTIPKINDDFSEDELFFKTENGVTKMTAKVIEGVIHEKAVYREYQSALQSEITEMVPYCMKIEEKKQILAKLEPPEVLEGQ